MSRARFALASATALTGLAVLTACSSGGSTTAAPSSPASASSGATTGQAGLKLTTVGSLGQVLTAPDGKTLYRFDADTTNPSVSNCNGQCATLWPPLIADPSTADIQGADKSLLGTVKRQDGTEQVTFAGNPVYEFVKDTAAGQGNGQGVQKTWWAITATGDKAAAGAPAAPPATTSSDSGNGGGYGGY
jgi:predicted lipoprotein with Yx(FWY)xxD motif